MPKSYQNLIDRSRRRGGSFLELALVFCLIALIAGAVFTQIQPEYTQNDINQAADELSIISNNVRSYYSGQATPNVGSCANFPATATQVPATVGGIFPSEMLSGAVANNLWNSGSAVSTALVYLCGANPVQFVIRYATLSSAQVCGNLVVRTSLLATAMNLTQIVVTPNGAGVNGQSTTFTTTQAGGAGVASGAVLPSHAAAACSGGAAAVDWYFKLNG